MISEQERGAAWWVWALAAIALYASPALCEALATGIDWLLGY